MSWTAARRDRIQVERAARTSDGAGGWTLVWSVIADRWAVARPVTGSEALRADSLRERESVVFELRDGADVLQGDRIVWRGDRHRVQAVSPLPGPRGFVEVRTEKIQAGEP